jgi:uncharacterized protein YqeY
MLLDQLSDDLKTAMKGGDTHKRDVLRMVLADIKNEKISKGEDLVDDDVMKVLKRGIKTRLDSATTYADNDRQDLADKESSEAKIIRAYLPEQISGSALEALVKAAIEKLGATSMKDMGGVMKAVMAEKGSAVDGKELSSMVKQLLG